MKLLEVARGDAPADMLLSGGKIVNVFNGTIHPAEVAIVGSRIASVGPKRDAHRVVDVSGMTLFPGLIDAHVHLESSLLSPWEFSRALVPLGTTSVVCDPHEIANVAGVEGVRWLLDSTEGGALKVFVNLPSCVPASVLASSGAELKASDLVELQKHPRVMGLGEMMNYPGTIYGDPGVGAKLDAFQGAFIDGHAPGLRGDPLQAYLAAGIRSDHECVSAEEAAEKLGLGMFIFVREGTAARNLRDLLPIVSKETITRCAFCTDDRHPLDLVKEGHLDHLLRMAIAEGLDPVDAIRMASLHPAQIYGLSDRGAIAPGCVADIVVCENVEDPRAAAVFCGGCLSAEDGKPIDSGGGRSDLPKLGSFRVNPEQVDLRIPDHGLPVRVIEMEEGQLLSRCSIRRMPSSGSHLMADPECRVAKMGVVERHHGSGRVGLGFLRGLGLEKGAIASSVAHDHHNLVVAGMDDVSMKTAIAVIAEARGGLVAAHGERVLALLPLPIGGLMSLEPLSLVEREMKRLLDAAGKLGSELADPFMLLSFAALEVIPHLKLTDRGLVDVDSFDFVSLYVS